MSSEESPLCQALLLLISRAPLARGVRQVLTRELLLELSHQGGCLLLLLGLLQALPGELQLQQGEG